MLTKNKNRRPEDKRTSVLITKGSIMKKVFEVSSKPLRQFISQTVRSLIRFSFGSLLTPFIEYSNTMIKLRNI